MHVRLDGEQLFLWRYRNFATQAQMAELAGILTKTLARVENSKGAVTPETARKIARLLDVEPKALERS